MTHPIASRRTFLKLSAALAGTALLPEAGAFAAGSDAARRTVIIDTDPGADDVWAERMGVKLVTLRITGCRYVCHVGILG